MTSAPTQTSAICEQIRKDIMNGTLVADTKLNTRNLAAHFGVGLSPIREALSRLSSDGWVVQSDRRGFSVASVTIEELWDLHRARCMLNESGLRESILHGDADWEENVLLRGIQLSRLSHPKDMSDSGQIDTWNDLHRAFHTSLISACRSQRLVRYCEQLFDEIERYRRLGLTYGTARGNVTDEHDRIAHAAVARDTEQAVELLNQHFTRTVEQVDAALRANSGQENK